MDIARIDFETAKANVIEQINNITDNDIVKIKTVWENSKDKGKFIKTVIVEIEKNARQKNESNK